MKTIFILALWTISLLAIVWVDNHLLAGPLPSEIQSKTSFEK